jgi:hypothetical protein
VEAQVERHSKSRIEIMVKARSQFKERRYYDSFPLFLGVCVWGGGGGGEGVAA